MSVLVEYNANNSGGGWWLTDENWRALADAGWKVMWADQWFVYAGGDHAKEADGTPTLCAISDSTDTFAGMGVRDGRYMGAIARKAWKRFATPADAMREFERVTGQNVADEGCNCCGAPHSFSWEGGYASGEGCIAHLYDNAPASLREAAELLAKATGAAE